MYVNYRSGRSYKESGSVQQEKMSAESIEGLMRVLLEDRKSRDAQFEEERQRQQRVVEEERLRQQRVAEEEKALMREQMEMLTRLVGESGLGKWRRREQMFRKGPKKVRLNL